MANPYQRCSRYWKKDNPPVQCERWDGHTWRHSAFDHDGLLLEWGGVEAPKWNGSYLLPAQGEEHKSHVHVPWNQPVPDNLEMDEDQLEDYKRRVAGLMEANHGLAAERDEARRDAELSQQQLHDVLDKLETIRGLTNGVPTRADA